MVKIVKAPKVVRGNIMTIASNLGNTPTTKKLPTRPQPFPKRKYF